MRRENLNGWLLPPDQAGLSWVLVRRSADGAVLEKQGSPWGGLAVSPWLRSYTWDRYFSKTRALSGWLLPLNKVSLRKTESCSWSAVLEKQRTRWGILDLYYIIYHILYWIKFHGTGVYDQLDLSVAGDQWSLTAGLNTDIRHFHFETNISQVFF